MCLTHNPPHPVCQYPGEGFYQILYSTDGSVPWPDPLVVNDMPDAGRHVIPEAPDEPVIPPPSSLMSGGLLNMWCAKLRYSCV